MCQDKTMSNTKYMRPQANEITVIKYQTKLFLLIFNQDKMYWHVFPQFIQTTYPSYSFALTVGTGCKWDYSIVW